MGPILEVKDLTVSFRTDAGMVNAVRGISFAIPQGKTVALVGESGSGKSVSSQAIMGILPTVGEIEAGSILFNDPDDSNPPVDIASLKQTSKEMRDLQGGRISIIFQEPMTSLSPLHTIGDQVTEALKLHKSVSQEEANAEAIKMFERVGFPNPERALETYPFELSGGLRQRAMIAMALICRPALLIADEPTTALDVTTQAQILELMQELQREFGMAILLITHDLGVVANMADEVVVMYHGEIMESGNREQIFTDPQHAYLKALLKAVPHFDMEKGERLVPIREIKTKPGSFLMERKTKDTIVPKTDEDLILDVKGLSKTFNIRSGWLKGKEDNKVYAVNEVSLKVERGKTLGLVGESGCGKTTLSKMIMRALAPNEGSVLYDDGHGGGPKEVWELNGKELNAYRQNVQFIFQDPFSSLNPRMPVNEILSEPYKIHGIGNADEQFERVRELMELVGLDVRFLRRYPHSFSGGQRQRLGIARALALKPQLVLCDEPVSALDVSVQAQVLNLLKDLQKELGLTYLFVSHNLAVIDYIADTIAVMCAGHIVEYAPKEKLFQTPVHPYTQALLAAVPSPDLEHPLDFSKVVADRLSNPAAWPAPFTIQTGIDHPAMIEIELGHFVRATGAIDMKKAS